MATGGLLKYATLGDDKDTIALDYDYNPTTTAIALWEEDQLDDVGGDLVRATSVAMRTLLSSFGEYHFDSSGRIRDKFEIDI